MSENRENATPDKDQTPQEVLEGLPGDGDAGRFLSQVLETVEVIKQTQTDLELYGYWKRAVKYARIHREEFRGQMNEKEVAAYDKVVQVCHSEANKVGRTLVSGKNAPKPKDEDSDD